MHYALNKSDEKHILEDLEKQANQISIEAKEDHEKTGTLKYLGTKSIFAKKINKIINEQEISSNNKIVDKKNKLK